MFDLHEQAEQLGIDYEIIVAEDGSRSPVNIIANHKIEDLSNCRHVIRKENVGQASTRNELARLARYDWIIFIDSDAKVIEGSSYLANYIDNIGKADVVVGCLKTPAVNYDPNRTLRFKYETKADGKRSASIRQQHPYSEMSCFNIMMHKPVFLSVLFDSDCREYGYEDVLFGVELEKRGIKVLHIDNPLIHDGLDTNESFIRKSETALRTLKRIRDKVKGGSRVDNVYNKVAGWHMAWAARMCYKMFGGMMRRNLMSKNPSLKVLSLYKLCYYATLK